TAPDARTVMITTTRPRASLLTWLSINSMNIAPSHLLKENAKALEKRVMGSGPFKFESYEPGIAISGTRNPQYFKKDVPYLDGIEYLFIPDENARLGALRTGQIQMTTRLKLAQAKSVESKDIVVQSAAAMSNGVIGGHVDKPPFVDPRVRQAISLAVDRQAALKAIIDNDGTVGSPIFAPKLARSPEELLTLPGYDPAKKAEDITRAKQLLAAAGHPNGFETEITSRSGHPQYEAISVFAVDQLRQIGITARIKAVENAVLSRLRSAGDFDMLVAAGTSYVADPSGTTNYWGPEARDFPVRDANIARLLEQVEAEFDIAKRTQFVRDLELALIEWAPYVQTFWTNEHDALATKVKGYTKMIGLFGNARHEGIWLDG
ncbi:MAG: ABC transporter substrate-binding protein, partial [Dehalococcoidia bacterium]